MSSERLQILEMVREGKISPEEGLNLINALDYSNEKSQIEHNNKRIFIKVYDNQGVKKANIQLPISLVDIGLKFGFKFAPELDTKEINGINFNQILDAVKNGVEGRVADIVTEEGYRVEVEIG